MLGIMTLLVALGIQIGFSVYQHVTKSRQTKLKHIIRIVTLAVFSLLLATGVYWWGFRWLALFILLFVLAALGVVYFIRQPTAEKEYKTFSSILSCLAGCALLAFAILPGILFPQFRPMVPTGPYAVTTTSVTFVDVSRVEPFSQAGENRKLSVQFWYPDIDEGSDEFPLVLFSHGSFGYRGSNLSTFEDLASNGYVVCSIDHSYHAFFAQHTDGSTALVNREFLNDAVKITNDGYDEQTTYTKTQAWLQLRTEDMHFVLEEVLGSADEQIPDSLYTLIDTKQVGLFGHSLGGAAAAQLGRELADIDAVVVIDGTMIGEGVGFEQGKNIFRTEPYPVPLLNLYNDRHYQDAQAAGMAYNNIAASQQAIEAYDVVIRDSGHLNFTDLPLFSPVLARVLGTGAVDSRYCIETMNQVILDFFNYTLKDAGALNLQTEY